jgi:hypothetical protein
MSGQLIFNEESMINGNIFKFEQRLQSHVNKYIENGAILTTYYSQRESSITVDRGLQDIDQLFGKKSPLRYNKIKNFPLYGFGQANPENSDENQIEDINIEGDSVIIPSTVVPKQSDFFQVNHLKMTALFQITSVNYDSMKPEGYYKIHYRLISTSDERLQELQEQVIETYSTELNAVGSNINPIIKEDDFHYRNQIRQMVNQMIANYKALYYNSRHNCFLYHHPELGLDWFDMCGNEFIAKHSLMNTENSGNVIVLNDKLQDSQLPFYYSNSVYNWIELGAPTRMIRKFFFNLLYADGYPYSSFARWGDGDIQIMQPLANQQEKINYQEYSFFDNDTLNALLDDKYEPVNEYEKLIWKYMHKPNQLSIHDVSLYTADALINSVRHLDTFLYTPIVIFIIRKILEMN